MTNETENSFEETIKIRENIYNIIIKLTRILIQRSSSVRRVCNRVWRLRLPTLSAASLLKKLRFLINKSDLRTIVRCFNHGIFTDDPDVICLVRNEIVSRGLGHTVYVQNIIKQYNIYYGSKQFFLHFDIFLNSVQRAQHSTEDQVERFAFCHWTCCTIIIFFLVLLFFPSNLNYITVSS